MSFQEDVCIICPGHFKEIFEMQPTHLKRMYVVDGGLTFNSPYPLLLRPQRQVDLLLSFDFSARPGDSSPPFEVGEFKQRSRHVCGKMHFLIGVINCSDYKQRF
jgi:predicted acylesterase/phospholipase RssA